MAAVNAAVPRGRVRRVNGPLVECEALGDPAVAELVALGERGIWGEVVAVSNGRVTVQAYENTGGLAPGDPARSLRRPLSAPLGPGLLGQVYDGLLRPLSAAPEFLTGEMAGTADRTAGSCWFEARVRSGRRVTGGSVLGVLRGDGPLEHRVLVPPGVAGAVDSVAPDGAHPADATIASVGGTPVGLRTYWPVRSPRPAAARVAAAQPLRTGQRVLDLMFPVALGGSAVVPGGFGTGKTVLLQQLAKWCDADVIVYVGCGERGNEMAEIVAEFSELDDPRTGGRLADRTVVIANTSNMPMMAREASIYTGVTVAEFYRDMGYAAVVIADSTSRWAEALREFASRSAELPAEEGYPPELASALAAFYERSGVVTTPGGATGSVTLVGAVSPPGGDLTEPVTAFSERFVRCRWTLDRDLAYGRHYPAVSWSGSFSRDLDVVAADHTRHGDVEWLRRRGRAADLLAESDRLGDLAELMGASALPGPERAVLLGGRLLREAVLQQSARSATDAYCSEAKTAALTDAVLDVVEAGVQAVQTGLPADVLEGADHAPLIRIRDETGPDDVDGVRERGGRALARVRELRA
ncbi:V-type ATP synthase subunit A [Pseudonocardia acidicola]|uniref:V-type ATP synthase subunit A n=1 Tax=Pseudonocardia acidicola TaxID=2724939 RepID=A0ABX1SAD1_9PSEU|nr:V-type ATP synthase subunit A [Pseudonocardia acidicola]